MKQYNVIVKVESLAIPVEADSIAEAYDKVEKLFEEELGRSTFYIDSMEIKEEEA